MTSVTVSELHKLVPHYLSPTLWGPGGWKFLESKYRWEDVWQGMSVSSSSGDVEEDDVDGDDDKHTDKFINACGRSSSGYDNIIDGGGITEARKRNIRYLRLIDLLPDRMYIALFMHVIPGLKCRYNFHQFLQSHPPIPGESCGKWVWMLHNDVRRRTHKSLISEEDARNQWNTPSIQDMPPTTRIAILNFRIAVTYCSNGMNHVKWNALDTINGFLTAWHRDNQRRFSPSSATTKGTTTAQSSRIDVSKTTPPPMSIIDMVSVSLGLIVVMYAAMDESVYVLYTAPISDRLHVFRIKNVVKSSHVIVETSPISGYRFYRIRQVTPTSSQTMILIDTLMEVVKIVGEASPLPGDNNNTNNNVFVSMSDVRRGLTVANVAVSPTFGKLCYTSTVRTLSGEPVLEVFFDHTADEYVIIQRHALIDQDLRHLFANLGKSDDVTTATRNGNDDSERRKCFIDLITNRPVGGGDGSSLCIFNLNHTQCRSRTAGTHNNNNTNTWKQCNIEVHMLEDHFVPGLVLFKTGSGHIEFVPINTNHPEKTVDEVNRRIKSMMTEGHGSSGMSSSQSNGFGINIGDEYTPRLKNKKMETTTTTTTTMVEKGETVPLPSTTESVYARIIHTDGPDGDGGSDGNAIDTSFDDRFASSRKRRKLMNPSVRFSPIVESCSNSVSNQTMAVSLSSSSPQQESKKV